MAAQSISFLGRIAFFMRGQTATKVWPVGHLLSSHEERRQRRAKGVPPLGIPKQLAGFLFRKAGGRADARTRLYTKKGLGWLKNHRLISRPGDWAFTHPPTLPAYTIRPNCFSSSCRVSSKQTGRPWGQYRISSFWSTRSAKRSSSAGWLTFPALTAARQAVEW